MTAIIGLAIALLSLAKGELAGTVAGLVLGAIGGAFSLWRAATFDRRAGNDARGLIGTGPLVLRALPRWNAPEDIPWRIPSSRSIAVVW